MTAYGIAADTALLVPRYSASLDREMTAYSALVTVSQLAASTLGDENPVSYGMGVSVLRRALAAARRLSEAPDDLDARGVVLCAAAIATSGHLGLGKRSNYAYDLYELEFIPEELWGVPYRKSLTTLLPRFLRAAAIRHEGDVRRFMEDAFGLSGTLDEMCDALVELFEGLGVDMFFEGAFDRARAAEVPVSSELSEDELLDVIARCMG